MNYYHTNLRSLLRSAQIFSAWTPARIVARAIFICSWYSSNTCFLVAIELRRSDGEIDYLKQIDDRLLFNCLTLKFSRSWRSKKQKWWAEETVDATDAKINKPGGCIEEVVFSILLMLPLMSTCRKNLFDKIWRVLQLPKLWQV